MFAVFWNCLFACLVVFVPNGSALVAVNPLFSDGLVLQTNNRAGFRPFIYGTASPNEQVTITGSLIGAPYSTQADGNGTWEIQTNPSNEFTANYSAKISGSTNATYAIEINNIRIGDVFICVGSDNMGVAMKDIENATAELEKSNKYNRIRIAQIPTINSNTPSNMIDNSKNLNIKWQVANSDTLPSFSAVCYLTVQKLFDIYGESDYNMGVIQASVDKSTLNCWMPQSAIKNANTLCKDNDRNSNSKGKKSIFGVGAGAGATDSSSVCNDSTLFNGMINPLIDQTYRSMIFYSGENEISSTNYGCKMGLTFNTMRDLYAAGDFSIGVIGSSSYDDNSTTFGELRNEELEILPRYNGTCFITSLTSTYDLGNRTNIVTRHKATIAERTALKLARIGPVIYYDHNSSIYDGPMIANALINTGGTGANEVLLNFTNLGVTNGDALELRDTLDCKSCCKADNVFEISRDNSSWYPISNYSVSTHDSSMILLISPIAIDNSTVYYIRYGFSSFVECAIYRQGSTIPSQAPFVVSAQNEDQKKQQQREQEKEQKLQESQKLAQMSAGAVKQGGNVALTPPMGFNSWNFAHCNMDERLVKQTAMVMRDSGLLDAGYEYINLDDCWQTDRTHSSNINEQVIIPDSVRYPSSMLEISNYLNELGFKFGIYTARKKYTCQSRYGSYMHEMIDVITYCNWNISYIKVDSCKGTDYSHPNQSWVKFRDAIDHNCSHPIVLSVESCSTVSGCGQWIGKLANLWRTTGDVQDNWASIMSNADNTEKMYSIAGPGHWNDPDMLQIGNPGLSINEERVQLSLWSIMASPLLIGTDLNSISNDSLNVLLNKEVIAVNQDVLGMQGHKHVSNTSGTEIWYRMLKNNAMAVALLNRDSTDTFDISVNLTTINATVFNRDTNHVSHVTVRDLWAHQDLDNVTNFVFVAQGVEPHSCTMIKVVPYYDST